MELTKLLDELSATEGVLFVVTTPGVAFEVRASSEHPVALHGGWAELKGDGWHAHLDMSRISAVQFVEQEDHGTVPTLYYVRFSSAEGETLFRAYFPNPYLSDDERPADYQPEKLAAFHRFRDRYIDQEGITFVQRSREDADRSDRS